MKTRRAFAIAVAFLLAAVFAVAQEEKPKPKLPEPDRAARPPPLSADVRWFWENAGAEFCWMSRDEFGHRRFRLGDEGEAGELPTFRWHHWPHAPSGLPKLPAPEQAFAVDVGEFFVDFKDADVEQFAGFDRLQSLSLGRMGTPRRLKELARAKQLRSLDLHAWGGIAKDLAGIEQLETLTMESSGGVMNGEVKDLAALNKLRVLSLDRWRQGGNTEAALKELAALKQLQSLQLAYTHVTDAGLKELAQLKQLRSLAFDYDAKGYKGKDSPMSRLSELAALEQLRSLRLGSSNVNDTQLKELAALKQLRSLQLGSFYVSNAGVKELAGLQHLESLDIRIVQHELLQVPVGLKQLRSLKTTQVTDVGLKDLARFPQLRSLNLAQANGVTDAGLKYLAELKQLESLNVSGTRVTKAGVSELKKALPALRTDSDSYRKPVYESLTIEVVGEQLKFEMSEERVAQGIRRAPTVEGMEEIFRRHRAVYEIGPLFAPRVVITEKGHNTPRAFSDEEHSAYFGMTLGDNGTYHAHGLALGKTYLVSVTKEGYQPSTCEVTLPLPQEVFSLKITLEPTEATKKEFERIKRQQDESNKEIELRERVQRYSIIAVAGADLVLLLVVGSILLRRFRARSRNES